MDTRTCPSMVNENNPLIDVSLGLKRRPDQNDSKDRPQMDLEKTLKAHQNKNKAAKSVATSPRGVATSPRGVHSATPSNHLTFALDQLQALGDAKHNYTKTVKGYTEAHRQIKKEEKALFRAGQALNAAIQLFEIKIDVDTLDGNTNVNPENKSMALIDCVPVDPENVRVPDDVDLTRVLGSLTLVEDLRIVIGRNADPQVLGRILRNLPPTMSALKTLKIEIDLDHTCDEDVFDALGDLLRTKLKTVKKLILDGCDLKHSKSFFEAVGELKDLSGLMLVSCNVLHKLESLIKAVSAIEDLTYLYLDNNNLGDTAKKPDETPAWRLLEALKSKKSITHVGMTFNCLSREVIDGPWPFRLHGDLSKTLTSRVPNLNLLRFLQRNVQMGERTMRVDMSSNDLDNDLRVVVQLTAEGYDDS